MKCFLEVVTTPTADTPGTLLLLHYDDCRYLIGNVSEGTQRACIERGIGLRKASTILLTGRTEWSTVGGLLGLILQMADVKNSATAELGACGNSTRTDRLDIYGTSNLNHLIAAARRFIFRTGIPLNATEFTGEDDVRRSRSGQYTPTWQDDRIKVYTMAIRPQIASSADTSYLSPRKRSYEQSLDDVDGTWQRDSEQTSQYELRKAIVSQMFNSGWSLDRLLPQLLSKAQLPAKLYVRDAETHQLKPYDGPLPGATQPVPDLTVWTREPWPGALTESLPPTKPATEAISYIIRNHPQRGKFLPEKAKALQVPKGSLWGLLANGHTVSNKLGEDVTPDMVLTPGKQGGGIAVVDIPTTDYIDGLINRAEWQDTDLLDGVEVIFWILGSGVASDDRLQRFQANMSSLKHIVSSPDYCPNILAFEAVATNHLRHRFIDLDAFPPLQCSPVPCHQPDEQTKLPPSGILPAERGQIITLEPRIELQKHNVTTSLQLISLQATIADEFKALGICPDTSPLTETTDFDRWTDVVPYGDAEVIILGTGSSRPSKCRNVSGTLIRVPGCGSYLLDCGEGTLGTLMRMFPPAELDEILRDLRVIWISHLHADHHLGIASLLKAWSRVTAKPDFPGVGDSTQQVDVSKDQSRSFAVISDSPMLHWIHEYGSAEDLGIERMLLLATAPSHAHSNHEEEQGTSLRHIVSGHHSPDFQRKPISTSAFLHQLSLKSLDTVYVNHCRGAQAIALTFRNGLKISYSGDCRPSANFARIGRDSHVLIHEATFQDDMRSEAIAKKHSTSGEALIVANEMRARVCVLTHFSQRYPEMPTFGATKSHGQGPSTFPAFQKVLEKEDPFQPSANMHDSADMMPLTHSKHAMQAGVISGSLSPREHSTSTAGALFAKNAIPRASTGHLELIYEEDIKELLARSGMKVIFGFDYMRVKLKDVPRLESKQPLLRRMYDEGIGKDASQDIVNDEDPLSSDRARELKEGKKKAKAAKMEQQRAANEKRAKSSEDKWAEAAKRVTRREPHVES